MTKMYVFCETHEDWHIVEVQGLKEDCVIICGHTLGVGMHDKIPRKTIRHWAWCGVCKEEKDVTEVYYDEGKIAVTLECGHEFYANRGKTK